jgi:hypothetical protein
LKEAFLTIGTLLLFTGCMGAIAGTTAMGAGANITPQALQQLLVTEVISSIIAFIGGALVMRNR